MDRNMYRHMSLKERAAAFARLIEERSGGDLRFTLAGRHRGVDCQGCHPKATAPTGEPFTRYQGLVFGSCASCHAERPTQPGFTAAPSGVLLDTPAQVAQHRWAVLHLARVNKGHVRPILLNSSRHLLADSFYQRAVFVVGAFLLPGRLLVETE